jgi:uroporphyrinogen decarboxylase
MKKISSRDLVLRTLSFDNPTKAPRQLWLLPWATDHFPDEVHSLREDFPDDIIHSPGFKAEEPKVYGDPYLVGEYIDDWRCIFENRQKGVIGEVKQAAIPNLDDLSMLQLPVENLTIDVQRINTFCRDTDRFVLAGCCPRPFERLQFLRTSVNLYIDIAEESPEFYALLSKVHQFYLDELELWAKTDVDGLSFMDDWGSQRSLLISPAQWRKIFKPLYKEYIDLAHAHKKAIFMHSDGFIADILPDLVEIELDAINSQLFIMDIEAIGKQFAGKITFWGEIDRQHILPSENKQLTIQAVKRVKEALWKDGGCIAQCEFGAGAQPFNVREVFKTWDSLF